jgi:hypothetical protein
MKELLAIRTKSTSRKQNRQYMFVTCGQTDFLSANDLPYTKLFDENIALVFILKNLQ